MSADELELSRHREQLARLLALSDGIFAVAITLLVLDLKLPAEVTEGQLLPALLNLSKGFTSYAISFFVIGLYWNVHRKIFRSIHRSDGRLTWLNLLFLFAISFLPVPTSILGRYSSQVAIVFYALCMAVIGLLSFSIWWYAAKDYRLLDRDYDPRNIRVASLNALIPPIVFLFSIGLAFVSIFEPVVSGPELAQYSWLLILIANIAIRKKFQRRATEE